MENRFDNVKKEMQLYKAGFIFVGFINVMFWKDFSEMWNDSSNDKLFVFLGGFAAIGSLIALFIHYLIYLKATKNIRENMDKDIKK
jgi:hypothetical protein